MYNLSLLLLLLLLLLLVLLLVLLVLLLLFPLSPHALFAARVLQKLLQDRTPSPNTRERAIYKSRGGRAGV